MVQEARFTIVNLQKLFHLRITAVIICDSVGGTYVSLKIFLYIHRPPVQTTGWETSCYHVRKRTKLFGSTTKFCASFLVLPEYFQVKNYTIFLPELSFHFFGKDVRNQKSKLNSSTDFIQNLAYNCSATVLHTRQH